MDVIFPDYHVQIREEDLIATVRDWHPKCETCEHRGKNTVGLVSICDCIDSPAYRSIVRLTDYCNHHTFLEATTIEPPA
jgi:hypothetical protein